MKRILFFIIAGIAAALNAGEFRIDTDREDALYKCGEPAVFTVTALDDDGNLLKEGTAVISFRKEKMQPLREEVMDFAENNPASYTLTLDEPGFIWCTVNNQENVYYPSPIGAAGFDAEMIEATTEEPADFDQFWADGIAEAQAIPLDPEVTPLENFSNPDFNGYKVSLANVDNTRIYGFLAVPKNEPGPFPIIIMVPGAGQGDVAPNLYFFNKPKVMTLVMNVHFFDPGPDITEQAFKELGRTHGTYSYYGAPDRMKYYHRRSILGINRAFEFVETLPQWDGENIGLFGSSQGGAYALILSGLNPGKVKFTVANVPAMCEHTAYKDGRSPGWPLLIDNTPEGTEKMAPYFDVVNFAARVDNPVCVGVGFIDVACGPSSVYAAFNKIKAPKKIYPSPKMGHSFDKVFVKETTEAMYKALGVEP